VETEELPEALARRTGEIKIEGVRRTLRDRLDRIRQERTGRRPADVLHTIAAHRA